MSNNNQAVASGAANLGDIITVRKLLSDKKLRIPLYQRPYKWTTRHVNQLLSDITIAHQRQKKGLSPRDSCFS